MDEDSILKFVSDYLKKKGFKQADHALQEELQQHHTNSSASSISSTSQFDSDIAKQIITLSEWVLLALH